MASVTLKSLLGKRSDLLPWLNSWTENVHAHVCIEDLQGQILFGTPSPEDSQSHPVLAGEETVGYVKGNGQAALIAQLLGLLLQKEAEKKRMGTEVLHYYQELNVIYNFSEKLSETIDPDTIARVALDQAAHSIPCDSGVVVLWDETARKLDVPAATGEPLFNIEQLSKKSGILLKISLNGQSEIMSDLAILKEAGMIEPGVSSLIYAAMKVKQRILGAIILAGNQPEQFTAAHLKLLVTLALQSSTAIESALLYEKNIQEVKEREEAILRIHEVTKKFVPNEFIRLLGKENLTDVRLGDQAEKNVTVLFTDIRDFTSLSEKMTPGENFRFVSSFNERLGPVIRSHQGFINQYLGDSIMAIFPREPEDALKAAIGMHEAIQALNEERKAAGLVQIRAGIGMHSGPLIMGITGDAQRLDAATIADTVNTASRIESLTKYYRSPLLLSGETLRLIGENDAYLFRQLGQVQLKGKQQVLSIVECLDGYPPGELNRKKQNLAKFREAMEAYREQQFEEALAAFHNILETDPYDRTAVFFMENAQRFLEEGVPEGWTGAVEMSSK